MSGQVYAVASGKGGVGKTTTVVNLGVSLRANDHSVAMVDADLGMPNLATFLGVEAESTIHDVLSGDASVDEALIEEADGFAVLAGSAELSGFASADPAQLGEILEVLSDRYDYVLIDTGAGLSYEDVLPLGLVDGIVLVTSPDPAALGDTKRTVEVAGIVDGSLRGVVVTYANDSTDAEAIADDLGTELLGVIPEDPAVRESTASGRPLEAAAPDSAAAEAYRALGTTVSSEPAEEPSVPDAAAAVDENIPADADEEPTTRGPGGEENEKEPGQEAEPAVPEPESESADESAAAESDAVQEEPPPASDDGDSEDATAVDEPGVDEVESSAETEPEEESPGGGFLSRLRRRIG